MNFVIRSQSDHKPYNISNSCNVLFIVIESMHRIVLQCSVEKKNKHHSNNFAWLHSDWIYVRCCLSRHLYCMCLWVMCFLYRTMPLTTNELFDCTQFASDGTEAEMLYNKWTTTPTTESAYYSNESVKVVALIIILTQ